MKELMKREKGITLVALVITIILLLILASISISTLNGNNGLINRAIQSKENSEISEEQEIIQKSIVEAMGQDKYGNLKKEYLSKIIAQNMNGEDVKVYTEDDHYVVIFNDKRVYNVDIEGNISEGDISILLGDNTPGEFTKGDDGKTLAGSQSDPYIIMSIEDLVQFSKNTNEGNIYNKKYIKLGRTLDFNSELSYCNYQTKEYNEFLGIEDDVGLMEALTNRKYAGFIPIGKISGTFVGDNKAIKNIYENRTEDNAGLFSDLPSGTVTNLEITGNIKSTKWYVGGISGYNGTITGCISRVNIEAKERIGGIVGSNGTVTDCKNYGNVTGENTIGGIGGLGTTISNCENYGMIISSGYAGGIRGRNGSAILNCKNFGKVFGNEQVGGISSSARAINCANFGNIEGNKYVGGIIGWGSAVNSYNSGKIKAIKSYAGGIDGYMTNDSPIINCYNSGTVEADEDVGGILGRAEYISSDKGRLINCYNVGELKGNKRVGGIVGVKGGTYGTHYVEKCYWLEKEGLECCSNVHERLVITDSQALSNSDMTGTVLLDLLNNYVETYNAGEDKTYSSSNDLLKWKIVENDEYKYPVFE